MNDVNFSQNCVMVSGMERHTFINVIFILSADSKISYKYSYNQTVQGCITIKKGINRYVTIYDLDVLYIKHFKAIYLT
jgi:hypothetical protein